MIQKTSARHISTAVTDPIRTQQPHGHGHGHGHHSKASDGPEIWGEWVDSRHYSLEVIQHPLRARMCGFGDKDRRPLAPAAVAKMIVRAEDNSIVDVDDVDVAFFVVAVDLWSADGKREMNLVLHPSSADRYIPTQASLKPRRRATAPGAPTAPRPPQSPGPTTIQPPTSFPLRPVSDAPVSQAIAPPQAGPGYPGYGFADPFPFGHPGPYQSSWPYPPPPGSAAGPVDRTQPAASQFAPREAWQSDQPVRPDADVSPFRGWNTDPHVLDHAQGAPPTSDRVSIDSTLRSSSDSANDPSTATSRDSADPIAWSGSSLPADASTQSAGSLAMPLGPNPRFGNDSFAPSIATADSSSYTHVPYTHAAPSFSTPEPASPAPAAAAFPSMPRHTYTRTLVGPLSANATRLLDEHRKPGIFFLFQDLSIRTEGTFRLRLRLMNVGAHPAPNPGAQRVHNDVSPILAQTFTESFVVYSAKRFPGVPDTTALSIAFGNQGQKLPLRNRHGSSKQRGVARRRGVAHDDSASEDSD